MTDFYQVGVIATLHKLGNMPISKLEEQLVSYAKEKPIALVLPSLYSEIEGEALKIIINELKNVEFIKDIIVTLGPCNNDEFKKVKEFFSHLPQNVKLIWNNGKRIKEIYDLIESAELSTGEVGKGKSVWMAYGYILSQHKFRAVALHDCDILSYKKDLLARLCYPIIAPSLNYDFCKAFYSRVTDRLHGRATRLLVTPLIRSFQKIFGYLPILIYFDSFRYALSGEFAMDIDLVRINRIPGDWGLEIGVLAEVYRNTALRRICQVDVIDNYEHKHQELSPGDSSKGLYKMAIDICKTFFRTLASEGIVFSDGFFKTLVSTYVKTAQDMLKRYQDDAEINCLYFDRHEESLAVETFTEGIKKASEIIMENPLGVPLITSWDRVVSAIPDIFEKISQAVEEDNKFNF